MEGRQQADLMQDRVAEMLSPDYVMFLLHDLDTAALTPALTLREAMQHANTILEHVTDLDSLDDLEWDCLARMIRVRWIFQNLDQEPIRKPLLVHVEHDRLMVDCGDTRLMALSLLRKSPRVSALITCTPTDQHRFENSQQIHSEHQLFKTLAFDPSSAQLLWRRTDPGTAWAVSWLELGDHSTGHHLHSIEQCRRILESEYSTSFRFTLAWFHE